VRAWPSRRQPLEHFNRSLDLAVRQDRFYSGGKHFQRTKALDVLYFHRLELL
jgi:hypothetical protein